MVKMKSGDVKNIEIVRRWVGGNRSQAARGEEQKRKR
jgi:hypothetical protein